MASVFPTQVITEKSPLGKELVLNRVKALQCDKDTFLPWLEKDSSGRAKLQWFGEKMNAGKTG